MKCALRIPLVLRLLDACWLQARTGNSWGTFASSVAMLRGAQMCDLYGMTSLAQAPAPITVCVGIVVAHQTSWSVRLPQIYAEEYPTMPPLPDTMLIRTKGDDPTVFFEPSSNISPSRWVKFPWTLDTQRFRMARLQEMSLSLRSLICPCALPSAIDAVPSSKVCNCLH